MKIIQSFWTKPFLQSGDSLKDSRMNGGWQARRYNYFSLALSCLQLRKFYDEVELVTDDLGKYLLIDKMKLPYTKVSLELNSLNEYHPGLWALGKIEAYRIQDAPFLHVDNDIFIWDAFSEEIENAALVAQNFETTVKDATATFNEIYTGLNFIPDYLQKLKGVDSISYSNAGILGGTDVSFFKNYTREIFNFLHANEQYINDNIKNLNSAYINVIYEQMVFNQLADGSNKSITHLFPNEVDIPRDIGFFHEANRKYGGYMHCCGTFKKNRLIYELLELKLKEHYPEYYELINYHINAIEI